MDFSWEAQDEVPSGTFSPYCIIMHRIIVFDPGSQASRLPASVFAASSDQERHEAAPVPPKTLCHYLEGRELLWDWPEEDDEVVALSWEKPLVHDSRLDMEPLGNEEVLC